jgi:hypothetical protein
MADLTAHMTSLWSAEATPRYARRSAHVATAPQYLSSKERQSSIAEAIRAIREISLAHDTATGALRGPYSKEEFYSIAERFD